MWDEQVIPFIVVELLSPGTEDEDLGKSLRKLHQPPGKWEVYEQILKIPYYVVFSRYTDELQVFKWRRGHYEKMPLSNHRFFLTEIQLGLGRWNGVYEGEERQWLRWYDATDNWIPTKDEKTQRAELATQRAELATQRSELATQRAEQRAKRAEQQITQERQRAELQITQERQRAKLQITQERQRAEQLAAKLRALGIDPDQL